MGHVLVVRDWSLITGRGATKWENCESETFPPPPPFKRVHTFSDPPVPSLWLKLQAPMLKLPQNCVCHPHLSMAKTFSAPASPPPPFFCRGKTSLFFLTFFNSNSDPPISKILYQPLLKWNAYRTRGSFRISIRQKVEHPWDEGHAHMDQVKTTTNLK